MAEAVNVKWPGQQLTSPILLVNDDNQVHITPEKIELLPTINTYTGNYSCTILNKGNIQIHTTDYDNTIIHNSVIQNNGNIFYYRTYSDTSTDYINIFSYGTDPDTQRINTLIFPYTSIDLSQKISYNNKTNTYRVIDYKLGFKEHGIPMVTFTNYDSGNYHIYHTNYLDPTWVSVADNLIIGHGNLDDENNDIAKLTKIIGIGVCDTDTGKMFDTDPKTKSNYYLYGSIASKLKLAESLSIIIGDTKYVYDNLESVEVDLTVLSKTSVITDWDSVTSNGEYSSAVGATNAPTSDIAYMGSVVRGATSITQKLYADTDDLIAVSEYIRRGKITKDADNNETITWGNWYCINYSVPTTASSQE